MEAPCVCVRSGREVIRAHRQSAPQKVESRAKKPTTLATKGSEGSRTTDRTRADTGAPPVARARSGLWEQGSVWAARGGRTRGFLYLTLHCSALPWRCDTPHVITCVTCSHASRVHMRHVLTRLT
eukprot:3176311-Rhodomonas_salina.3